MEFTHCQVLRSHADKRRFLIVSCSLDADAFDSHVPQPVRALGPWMAGQRIPIERLAPEHRLALSRDHYCVVEHDHAVLDPAV